MDRKNIEGVEPDETTPSARPPDDTHGAPCLPLVNFVRDGQKNNLRPIHSRAKPLVMAAHDALVPRSYLRKSLVQRFVIDWQRRLLSIVAAIIPPRRPSP